MLVKGFKPHICKIVERMDISLLGLRQTMLFSATFQSEIQVGFVFLSYLLYSISIVNNKSFGCKGKKFTYII